MSKFRDFVARIIDSVTPDPGQVEFICENPLLADVVPQPIPAASVLPNWMKDLPQFAEGTKRNLLDPEDKRRIFDLPTAKRCVPMVDGNGLGWLMPLSADLRVATNEDATEVRFNWTADFVVAETHVHAQTGPNLGGPPPGRPVVKMLNPWIVRTPPGWSTLFIQPINRAHEHFTPLGAIVATDMFPRAVNFPGFFGSGKLDFRMPAGTPLVQAIPFKRGGPSKKAVVRMSNESERALVATTNLKQSLGEGYYRREIAPKTRPTN